MRRFLVSGIRSGGGLLRYTPLRGYVAVRCSPSNHAMSGTALAGEAVRENGLRETCPRPGLAVPKVENRGMVLSHASVSAMMQSMHSLLAKRMEKDRDRQAERRADLRAKRRPFTHSVDAALVESMAFHLAIGKVASGGLGQVAIPVKAFLATAQQILVDRDLFDPDETRIAIKQRLAPRSHHRRPGAIPMFPEERREFDRLHQ